MTKSLDLLPRSPLTVTGTVVRNEGPSPTRPIVALIAGLGVLGAAAFAGSVAIAGFSRPTLLSVVLLAAAIVALGALPPFQIELRRQIGHISAGDAALVAGLVLVPPAGFVLAVAIAELITAARGSQPLLKRGFNLASMVAGSALATLVYHLVAPGEPLETTTWIAAVVGLAALTLLDTFSLAVVMSLTDPDGGVRDVLAELLPTALLNLMLSSATGIVALIMAVAAPAGLLLLLLPFGVGLHLSARAVAQHRVERLRLRRLYDASSQLTGLIEAQILVTRVAVEARSLGTAMAAVAILERRDGSRTSIRIDDHGAHQPAAEELDALLELIQDRGTVVLRASQLPSAMVQPLPGFARLIACSRPVERGGRLVAAVAREVSGDELDDDRTEVLATFLSHAATAANNVALHADLRDAFEREKEHNRSRDEFVAAVSHELLTPLTGITGAVQTLQRLEGRFTDHQHEQLLSVARRQSDRLQRLIRDLIDVAAIPTSDTALTNLDLARFARDIHQQFDQRLQGRLSTEVRPPQLTVLTDRRLLVGIVDSLLDNAAKYAPEGPIELRIAAREQRVELSVRDHGPGIPEAFDTKVFRPFVQLDQSSTRTQGGTGIGLHLAARRAELLGGNLRHERPEQGGARFVLTLPEHPLMTPPPAERYQQLDG